MSATKQIALILAVVATPLAVAQTPELADPEPGVAAPAGEALAQPLEMSPAVIEPSPAPAAPMVAYDTWHAPAPAVVCHPLDVVDVRTKLSAKRLYRRGGPPVNQVICVYNPVDCCTYSVPVCVPCCCVGQPQVCPPRPGILRGRCKVDIVWDCGFVATVTFLKHGGAIITYAA